MEKDKTLDNFYDVVIIGGGPAGLTAAIYLARACYRVLVVEKEKFGGQITITSEVVNYPGIEHTNGSELTETMRRQAQNFGAEFKLAEVISINANADVKEVKTSSGTFKCFGILIATGARPRMLGFEGEARFRGHGVAYCATCDGEFFTGKDVFVVGGGFAAAEEGVFLTKYAKHVYILVRKPDFSCAKAVADHAKNHEKITVLTNTEVVRAEGDSLLRSITYKNNITGEETVYKAADGDTFGIFVFAGYEPATELVKDIVELDKSGYIVTDRNQKTSTDGVYAAGDVCIKALRQVVTAVGDGALAATELEKYASRLQKETGISPVRPVQSDKSTHGTVPSENSSKTDAANGNSGLFSPDMLAQLEAVFEKMSGNVVLRLCLDERPVSSELKEYMESLAALTDKISISYEDEVKSVTDAAPFVKIISPDGSDSGLAFHGVPGGHEFTSFILGIYNVSGPGQAVPEDVLLKIKSINKKTAIKIMVSLTCSVCPDLVVAAQRIAALNPLISADIYDINHFEELKDKYQIMSVPCMVINDGAPVFGKKDIQQIIELI